MQYSSTARRSTESTLSETRHAAREKLEELLSHEAFDDAGRRQQTEEDTDTDPLAAKASRLTNGSLHRNPGSDSRLKSPNKKKSALTVSCSLMIHCSLL